MSAQCRFHLPRGADEDEVCSAESTANGLGAFRRSRIQVRAPEARRARPWPMESRSRVSPAKDRAIMRTWMLER